MSEQALFDHIAHHYDYLYAHRVDDIAMWLNLCAEVDGPILEIGCGTGRLSLPLLNEGFDLTGIDLSPQALALAKAKLAQAGINQSLLYQADMRDFDLPQKEFALAFIPINTFMHNLTQADQIATLEAVHAHLRPQGELIIDLYHPHPQTLAEADGLMHLVDQQTDADTQHLVQWYSVRHLDVAEQIQDVSFMLDEITSTGEVHRQSLNFAMRYLHRYELTLLLEKTGFTPIDLLGDYEMSPFEAESPRMIAIALKSA